MPLSQTFPAIRERGQNARLAARLTGYKIDIKSETQAKDAPGFRYEDYLYDDEEFEEEEAFEEGYVEEEYGEGEYAGEEFVQEEDTGEIAVELVEEADGGEM